MSRSVKLNTEDLRERQARAQEADRIGGGQWCAECQCRNDHTWWCSIAPEVLPNGKRPYYWRD